MTKRRRPYQAEKNNRKNRKIMRFQHEGPSGESHNLSVPSEEECKLAIEQKGIVVGTSIVQDGESIPRKVEAILLPSYRLQLVCFSPPVFPTKVHVHQP